MSSAAEPVRQPTCLLRYRDVVRQAIQRHGGAEIRTEGDWFYVVLPSASDAVLCGLDIVDAVAAANAEHPDDPIRVGVGVHAGDARLRSSPTLHLRALSRCQHR